MQGSDLTAKVRAELEQIMPLLSAYTGLPTRWSGVVELVPDADFKGKKRFTCDIQINADLASQEVRWLTLIHESLHAHSAGYNGTDYRLHRGWEEGVVEQLQRLLRPSLFPILGINFTDVELREADRQHPFSDRVEALEAIRRYLPVLGLPFYLHLLSVPISARPAAVFKQVQQLPEPHRRRALYVLSASDVILRKSPSF